MAKIVSKTEVLFLGINKWAILIIMSLSLLLTVMLGGYSLYQFFQKPAQPATPQVAKLKSIDIADFLSDISEKNKIASKSTTRESDRAGMPDAIEKKNTPAFLTESTRILICSLDFAKSAGVQIPAITDEDKKTQIETLRSAIEKSAAEVMYRSVAYQAQHGEKAKKWVSELEAFVCRSLKDDRLITAKKDNQGLSILRNIINFYAEQSIRTARENANATSAEQARFDRELGEELARVAESKAKAQSALIGIAICLGAFFALALYLIFAKIENHLRDIKSGFVAEHSKGESA